MRHRLQWLDKREEATQLVIDSMAKSAGQERSRTLTGSYYRGVQGIIFAAYLSKHHRIYSTYQIGFYVSGAESVRCPLLVIAILASVVGSQAIISGTFSIINQSLSLGCFPRLRVVLPLECMLVSKMI
ncbi:hypothetical protein J5N97_022627 [Dioscorea zingiberensis]|uniref:K+ potassium transporter integral membrane domain-containing protein n=1 Tax=Dioscorea zingiberensis TaxID=325984 RepID=A0A9D5HB28_9LILI|nr:hypothetical protein J5N97_022627 [Dioscorea zingiberensis]